MVLLRKEAESSLSGHYLGAQGTVPSFQLWSGPSVCVTPCQDSCVLEVGQLVFWEHSFPSFLGLKKGDITGRVLLLDRLWALLWLIIVKSMWNRVMSLTLLACHSCPMFWAKDQHLSLFYLWKFQVHHNTQNTIKLGNASLVLLDVNCEHFCLSLF